MVWYAHGLAAQILRARSLVGEDRDQQIIGAHALDVGRDFAPAAKARQRQEALGIPAPAGGEHRRRQHRLDEDILDAGLLEEAENRCQRESVVLAERDDDPVVGRSRLQLYVERTAEALAQRQAPRTVYACAERRVDDQLHPAGFVEEALRDDAGGRGDRAERSFSFHYILHRLLRAEPVEPALALEVLDRGRGTVAVR